MGKMSARFPRKPFLEAQSASPRGGWGMRGDLMGCKPHSLHV
jgi:hypothetical protein